MAADKTNKDNYVPKLLFYTQQWNIWMRPSIEKPEHENGRLGPTALVRSGKTRGLMGTGVGLASQEATEQVFGRFWNRTEPFI